MNGEAEFEQLRELIRNIFKFYSNTFRVARLTRTLLEKVVFEFKMSLPPDHELSHSLGFYWYLRGFFSDRLYACLNRMQAIGELETTDEDLLMMPADVIRAPILEDRDLQARIKLFVPTLGEYDPFAKTDDIITKHYLKYAPSPFCISYSRSFVPVFRQFLETVSEGHPVTLGPRNLRTLTRARLEEGTKSLPAETFYSDFTRIYLLFERLVLRLLEHGTRKEIDEALVRETEKATENVWGLFCLFLRERAFDPVLTYRLPYWQAERQERQPETATEISRLYDHVLTLLGESRFGEQLVEKNELIPLLKKAISENRVSWVDSDSFGLDWAELRTRPLEEIVRLFSERVFSRLFVRYVDTDGSEKDWVFKVREPVAAA